MNPLSRNWVLNGKQNNTNPISLDPKLRKELSIGGSSNFRGFLGVGSNEGNCKKSSEVRNILFKNTINPENRKHLPLKIKKYIFYLVKEFP